MIGDSSAIEYMIHQLRDNVMVSNIEDDLSYCLSYKIKLSEINNWAYLRQPCLNCNLTNKSGSILKGLQNYNTPETSNLSMMCNTDETESATKYKHNMHWSGVGKLLYIVNSSQLDIENYVHKWSKVLYVATNSSFK